MAQYDVIIAGAGAAGLSLAYEMAASRLRGQSILIVDRQLQERGERTWAYWSNRPSRIDHLITHSWHQVEFVSDHFQRVFDTAPYQYHAVRASDFYRGMRSALAEIPGVQFLQARVDEVGDSNDLSGARVVIDGVPHGARWAFDSTYNLADLLKGPRRYQYLKQHFKGWEIEAAADCFDPIKATLFDLRTPQKGALRFFTILPYTRRRAQVIYSNFSSAALSAHEYDRAIGEYLESVLGITRYRTGAIETGVVPFTDKPVRRKISTRALAIGTRGGLVRPTFSSAFPRILHDSRAIVDALITFGDPFHLRAVPPNYRLSDSLMLQVIQHQGENAKAVLTHVFKTRSIHHIFAFLDETATLSGRTRLISAIPGSPFLNALFRVKLLRKV